MACLLGLFKANSQDFVVLVCIYQYDYLFLVSYNAGGLKWIQEKIMIFYSCRLVSIEVKLKYIEVKNGQREWCGKGMTILFNYTKKA